jgi:DSF synthase
MNSTADIEATGGVFDRKYDQIEVRYDPELATAWTHLKPSGAPCFNLDILNELRAHDSLIESSGGRLLHGGEPSRIHYYVVASRIEGIFNLGGDLMLFASLIEARERDALRHYAKLCIDNMHARIRNYNCPLTTISLVQGVALGGGFETVLSSNVIIAERRSRMGTPEILFNLFPGMGAYSLLCRRVGMKRAEEMIISGRVYTAEELHGMGVVDVLAEDGAGEATVHDYIRRHERRRNGVQAVFSCRKHFHPVSYEEMFNIADIWVEAALRLKEKDLKLMGRLVRSQLRLVQGGETETTAEQER